jgi:hypothetical protein
MIKRIVEKIIKSEIDAKESEIDVNKGGKNY